MTDTYLELPDSSFIRNFTVADGSFHLGFRIWILLVLPVSVLGSRISRKRQGAVMFPRCYPPMWIYKTLEENPKGSAISTFLP